jgi:hypothetical protein
MPDLNSQGQPVIEPHEGLRIRRLELSILRLHANELEAAIAIEQKEIEIVNLHAQIAGIRKQKEQSQEELTKLRPRQLV